MQTVTQRAFKELAGNATLLYYMTEEAQEGKKAFLERGNLIFSLPPTRHRKQKSMPHIPLLVGRMISILVMPIHSLQQYADHFLPLAYISLTGAIVPLLQVFLLLMSEFSPAARWLASLTFVYGFLPHGSMPC